MDDFARNLDGARRGEPGAFACLYEGLVRPVAAYLRSRGVREVEDATSEVFLDAFRGLGRFSGDEAAFRSWVFTIAHRRSVDAVRRAVRVLPTEELDPERHGGVAGSAEEVAIDVLAEERVRELLEHVTAAQREVLVLRLVGDLTVEQVAQVLGRRPGAVKALQRRGLATLREILEGVPL